VSKDDFVGYAVPAITLSMGLLAWEGFVRYFAVPSYLLPAPSLIIATLITDWPTLGVKSCSLTLSPFFLHCLGSLWVTLTITLEALLIAVVGSVALAIIFAQSRLVERAFYPFAVAMQVTPIVAIAPLLLIYLTPSVAVLVCAFLVAFFPLLANTTLGLSSADHNLVDLFQMYRASRIQQFMLLRLPSALPYFLAGLRISGGLALIGAIVAEIAAGSAGQGSGLAYRIVESGFRLNIPRMFAALLLISVAGITIHLLLTALSHWLLRDWHDSEHGRET
jgi:NitT/TauT family transport system permease protein